MKTKISLIVLLLTAAAGRLHAQVDPHFSQYYAYPMWLNPALTGVFNGDTRVSANYKNQWANVNRAYQTTAVSADIKPTDRLSVGVTILNQSAGGSTFNYFSGYGSLAYSITISGDENQRINFGLQAGMINRSFDMSKLQFGNQFNTGVGFDPSLPSYENFSTTNTTVFDAGAGVFYYNGDPEGRANLFGGVSVAHLSRPKDGFAANTGAGPQRIPMRYMAQAGVRIKALDGVDITPNALFIQQQKTSIKAFGVYSEFRFQNDNGLIMGGMYRMGDAAVASLGYHVSSLIVGASYDFNTSSLTRATNGNGGIELSISYVFRKRIQQPEPICPRL